MAAKSFKDWLRTLGAPEDPVATDTTSEWSAMSLLKAIFGKINDGSLAAGIASAAESQIRAASAAGLVGADLVLRRARAARDVAETASSLAEGFVQTCHGAVAKCANYMKLSRTNALATAADAVSTAADVATASAQALVATDAANRMAGMALLGDRAKRDASSAAASATAAAASAASIVAESLVLGVQVYT